MYVCASGSATPGAFLQSHPSPRLSCRIGMPFSGDGLHRTSSHPDLKVSTSHQDGCAARSGIQNTRLHQLFLNTNLWGRSNRWESGSTSLMSLPQEPCFRYSPFDFTMKKFQLVRQNSQSLRLPQLFQPSFHSCTCKQSCSIEVQIVLVQIRLGC